MNELFQKPGTVDMSPEAIASRLHMLGELYKLGMSLSRAKFLDPAQQAQADAVKQRLGLVLPPEKDRDAH